MTAPHLMEQADEDGFKPIHLAVIQGTLETVNLLLANKVNVNALDNEGHSVVHWATGMLWNDLLIKSCFMKNFLFSFKFFSYKFSHDLIYIFTQRLALNFPLHLQKFFQHPFYSRFSMWRGTDTKDFIIIRSRCYHTRYEWCNTITLRRSNVWL